MTVLLCIVGAAIGVALDRWRGSSGAEESLDRPWAGCGAWSPATVAEQREARARATEVARLTVGEEVWAAFTRNEYVDLPSTINPETHYRLRPARRVEIRSNNMPLEWGYERTHAYLCVYPTYEMPAVEFLAQIYLRLRDDEALVLATGRRQPRDGRIPNVF